jgi:ABC-2 type transport system ATP-binding protein
MDAANKRIGAYSKGMRQRVKLAQALVHDPEVLILDEPLSGMDPLGRRKTMRMIRDWAKQGKSVLVSSHILHEIESMTTEHPADQQRPDPGGGQRPSDSRSDRHASAHGLHPRADPRGLAREFLRAPTSSACASSRAPSSWRPEARRVLCEPHGSGATGAHGRVEEVTSPDDNLQAVFKYLVKG